MEVGRISIRVVPDLDGFYKELKTELEAIEKRLDSIKIKVELNAHGLSAQLRALLAALQVQAKTQAIKIPVEFDRKGTLTGLGDQELAKLSKSLSQAGGSAKFAQRTFLGLTRTGWIMGAAFAFAAPALALISSLVASLPSLMGAAGAAGAAMYLGWDGIKEAASVLTPEIDKLKEAMSARFKEGFTPQFERLRPVLSSIQDEMLGVADGWTAMFTGFTDVVSTPEGIGTIEGIIENTGKLLKDLKPGVEDFTHAFLNMGLVGSQNFGKLSNAINTFADRFDQTVTNLAADGTFDKMFSGLEATTIGLGDLFNSAFAAGARSMGEIGDEMGGFLTSLGGFLEDIEPLLTSISGFLLDNLSYAFDKLGPALEKHGPVLQKLLEDIDPLVKKIIDLAAAFIEDLVPALEAVEPAVGPLADGLSALAGVLEGQGSWLVPAVATFWGLSKALDAVGGALKVINGAGGVDGVMGKGGKGGDDVGKAGTKGAAKYTDGFKSGLKSAGLAGLVGAALIEGNASFMEQANENLHKLVTPGTFQLDSGTKAAAEQSAEEATKPYLTYAQQYQELLKTAPEVAAISSNNPAVTEGTFNGITQQWEETTAGIAADAESFPAKVQATLGEGFQQFGEGEMSPFSALGLGWDQNAGKVLTGAAALPPGVESALGGLFAATMRPTEAAFFPVSGLIDKYNGQAAATAGQLPPGVESALGGLFAATMNPSEEAWLNVGNIFDKGKAEAALKAGQVPPEVEGQLSGLGGVGSNAGSALSGGLLGSLKSGIASVLSEVGSWASRIAAVKGPIPYDRKVLVPAGLALTEGLSKGLTTGFAEVLRDVSGYAGQISKNLLDQVEDPDGIGVKAGKVFAHAYAQGLTFDEAEKKIEELKSKTRENLRKQLREDLKNQGLADDALDDELERQLAAQLPAAFDKALMDANLLVPADLEINPEMDRSQFSREFDWLRQQLRSLEDTTGIKGFADEWIGALDTLEKHGEEVWSKHAKESGLATLPEDFAKAQGEQLMSDLGFGSGAVPELVRQVTEVHYHVADMAAAQEAERNRKAREALQFK
ncbi:hypothetical protein GS454_01335 [Rhodococcus hoagii]|nr:hypothetical protein [Prescottella equi]